MNGSTATFNAVVWNPQESITLRMSKWRSVTALFCALLMTAGGIALLYLSGIKGILPTAIFGIYSIYWMLIIFGDATFLRIEPDGIVVRSFYKTTEYRWREVEKFSHSRYGMRRFSLGISFADPLRQKKWYRRFYRCDVRVLDDFGINGIELAEMLERRRLEASARV